MILIRILDDRTILAYWAKKIKKSNLLLFAVLFEFLLNISCSSDKVDDIDLDLNQMIQLEGSFENKFSRYEKYQRFRGNPTQSWDEIAWRGERVYKQIVLWSSSKIQNLNYNLSEFKSENGIIPNSFVKLLFGQYAKGDPEPLSCSQYPFHQTEVNIIDVLSDVKQTTLNNNDPIKMWIIIDVPEMTIPGNYSGVLTVSANNSTEITFKINLKIYDHTLPEVDKWKFHLDLWQYPVNILDIVNTHALGGKIKIWSDEHFALLESAYRMLYNCGQKVITTYIIDGALGAESMVTWIFKRDGTWGYDFSVFEKYVSTLMSWGISKQISCFSLFGWYGSRISYLDESDNKEYMINLKPGTAEYRERWNHFLTEFKKFLISHGWFNKTVLYMDEVPEETLLQIISVVHENDPLWKLGISHMQDLSKNTKSKFYDVSGILEYASHDGISKDALSTFYTSCTHIKPNSFITPKNNTAEMTWMAWHALKENYDGYLRWAYDFWQLEDPLDIRDGKHTAGDFSLIYRSSNSRPVKYFPSLRLEMLRDGIQDYEKVKILRHKFNSSNDSEKLEKINQLETVIWDFDKFSGSLALELVQKAQQLLDNIE